MYVKGEDDYLPYDLWEGGVGLGVAAKSKLWTATLAGIVQVLVSQENVPASPLLGLLWVTWSLEGYIIHCTTNTTWHVPVLWLGGRQQQQQQQHVKGRRGRVFIQGPAGVSPFPPFSFLPSVTDFNMYAGVAFPPSSWFVNTITATSNGLPSMLTRKGHTHAASHRSFQTANLPEVRRQQQ